MKGLVFSDSFLVLIPFLEHLSRPKYFLIREITKCPLDEGVQRLKQEMYTQQVDLSHIDSSLTLATITSGLDKITLPLIMHFISKKK